MMEVTPVTVGSKAGTWWATELPGFLLHGAATLSIWRATHKS